MNTLNYIDPIFNPPVTLTDFNILNNKSVVVPIKLTIRPLGSVGPGYQISWMKGVLETRLINAHTPIDEHRLDLRFGVLMKFLGDEERTKKIADMYTATNSCRAYVYAVGQALDRGETTRKDAAGAILYAAEKATWMAGEAIQALGGVGYTNEFSAGRLWRDAKLYEIGAGTSEVRRMLIGRELMAETA